MKEARESWNKKLMCPTCLSALKYKDIRVGKDPFPCPNCGKKLCNSRRYLLSIIWIGLAASFLLTAGLGFRGLTLFLIAIPASFPLVFLTATVALVVAPPKLQLWTPKE
jgi:hypothetical protein